MLVEKLDNFFYPDVKNNWDDEIFREVILEYLQPEMTLLDVGAGSGILPQMNFKEQCQKVVGVDPDQAVLKNPYVHEAHVAFGEEMPLSDGAFDMVISDNVWEHVAKPQGFLAEVSRVLKPGGFCLAKTTNEAHYVPWAAKLTPHWFHEFYNSLRGRSPEDTFPTQYKLNSRKSIYQQAREAGFRVEFFRSYEKRPEYLRVTALTYLFGILYERLVNMADWLERFRVVHVVVLRKESSEDK